MLHTSLAQAAEDMEAVNQELLQQRERFQALQGNMQSISDSQLKVESSIEANAVKLDAVHGTAQELGEGMAVSLTHLVGPSHLHSVGCPWHPVLPAALRNSGIVHHCTWMQSGLGSNMTTRSTMIIVFTFQPVSAMAGSAASPPQEL